MLVDKELKKLFNLLVETLSLSVHLGVVGHRGSNFNSQELAEPTHEVQHELGSPVADDFFGEAMELPNIVTKEVGDT